MALVTGLPGVMEMSASAGITNKDFFFGAFYILFLLPHPIPSFSLSFRILLNGQIEFFKACKKMKKNVCCPMTRLLNQVFERPYKIREEAESMISYLKSKQRAARFYLSLQAILSQYAASH